MADATVTTADWTTSAIFEMSTTNGSLGPSTSGRGDNRHTWLVDLISTTGSVGLLLNLAVIAVLIQKRIRSSATDLYLLTLAVADLLVCIIVVPVKLVDIYHVFHWSSAGCLLYVLLRYTPMFVSMNVVLLIGLERCIAVVLPSKLAAFTSGRNVNIQLVLVWLAAGAEMVFLFAIIKATSGDENSCTIYHREDSFYYMFVLMVIMPTACLFVAYGIIVVAVLRRRREGRVNAPPPSSVMAVEKERESHYGRSSARLIIMCAVISVLFMVCWMPIFVVMYMIQFGSLKYNYHLVRYVHAMFYLHPVLNPLVYFFADARFRTKLVSLFRRKKLEDEHISMGSVTDTYATHE